MFETVLVASRGPVARSVVRTCQGLGIRAVAVHSEADAGALHVAEADDSVLLGPAPPAQSYLDLRRVVEAALQSGAQAVHPGAGALAVDPAAALAVQEAGLVWVGAPPEVLDTARSVPAAGAARTVTVLVLAPAGAPAVALCDLERVDARGAVLAAPAPDLGDDRRRAAGDAAVAAVTELGGAGVACVEVPTGPPWSAGAVRWALPVEHPVAALLADVDLVHEQLLAAAGETTGWRGPTGPRGAALALRVVAVDLGADGARISRWVEPTGVRTDSGYREGDVVPPWYDPLLATVTVAGSSDDEVLAGARRALREMVVEGPRTNLSELRSLLDDPSAAA